MPSLWRTDRISAKSVLSRPANSSPAICLRWRRLPGQFGGLAKVGSGSFHAAILSPGMAPACP